jgi:enediyne biosynthesis protein E4
LIGPAGRRRHPLPPLAAAVLAAAATACGGPDAARAPSAPAAAPVSETAPRIRFTDVTAAAGISFVHNNGAFGRKYLPETMGSGVVVFDYDGDGDDDLYFVNSSDFPGHPTGRPSHPALYRNDGGRFVDVTKAAGLDLIRYGMGGAAADYDGDGHVDLFVNCLGPDLLFHNRGDGTFEEVAARAGVGDPGFGSSATWLDADGDGRPDLFLCNYIEWSEATDIRCTLDGTHKSYCTPEPYHGRSSHLFHNRGDGTFEDVSETAGVLDAGGKALGVVAFDADGDGRTDLAVANDTQPNRLYRNEGGGRFRDVAVTAGIAFSEDGRARGAMGIDAADYDGSGRPSLVIGNFSNEMLALYHNEGNGLFVDDAPTAGIGLPSLLTLAFGAFFFDADLDGRPDIFIANGHVEDAIAAVQPDVTYAQPPHLFRNVGGGKFESVTQSGGADLMRPMVARGAATLDFDGDGDLDIVVTTNGGPARLLRNDTEGGGRSLRVRLEGAAPNRDALGAAVSLTVDPPAGQGGAPVVLHAERRSASSYLSQCEPVLTFGLGRSGRPARLDVRWPDGTTATVRDPEPGRVLIVRQEHAVAAAAGAGS